MRAEDRRFVIEDYPSIVRDSAGVLCSCVPIQSALSASLGPTPLAHRADMICISKPFGGSKFQLLGASLGCQKLELSKTYGVQGVQNAHNGGVGSAFVGLNVKN